MKKILRALSSREILLMCDRVKRRERFIVIVLLIAMFLNLFPFHAIIAEDTGNSNISEVINTEESNSKHSIDVQAMDIPILSEDTSKRTGNEKHFRKQDGSYEVAIYDSPVHYKDGDDWLDIDNTLDYNWFTNSYKNKANAFDIEFPKDITKSDIKVSMDDYDISWQLLGSKSSNISVDSKKDKLDDKDIRELSNINQKVEYLDVLSDIDLVYKLEGTKIKEEFVLDSYQKDLVFEFEYKLKGLYFEEIDGNLVLVNEYQEVILKFDPLIMYDSNYNASDKIDYVIEEIGTNKYSFKMIPNDSWLEEAIYPVIIDPTIFSFTNNTMNIIDTYIWSYYPNDNFHLEPTMYIGGNSYIGQFDGMINFYLPNVVMDQMITYAHMSFTKYNVTQGAQINLYQNSDTWISNGVTWNNAPEYEDNGIIDYYVGDSSTPFTFDITESVKEWQEAGVTWTPGFRLIYDEGIGTVNQVYQYQSLSSNNPVICIGYQDSTGLKDYWTYTSQDMGALGTGYISDYTGNLTWVRNDFSLNNEFLSLSLSFYYSVAEKDEQIGYGYGWKSNYNMQILKNSSSEPYYLYKPDGEKIYFSMFVSDPEEGDYYLSEDGSLMRLFVFDNYLELETQNGLTYTFERYNLGRLYKITEDQTDHQITIQYKSTSSKRVSLVTDEVGNHIYFEYNASDMLNKTYLYLAQNVGLNQLIEYKTYTYDPSNNLNYVNNYYNYNDTTMSYANYTRYGYLDHKLTDVQNFSLTQYLYYTYLPNNKVSHVEVMDNNEMLSEFDIEYFGNQTTYTYYDGNYINYVFDGYGHTTTVFDSYGNSQYFKYSGLFYAEDTDGVTGNYDFFYYNGIELFPDYEIVHKLVEKSDILKQTQNPVSNHGFEIEEGWMFNTNDFSSISYTENESLLGSSSLSIRLTKPIGVPYASQSMYLTAGTYTLIGYIKNSGGSSTSGAYMTVSGATIISTDDKVYESDEWQKFKLEFTVSTTGPVTLKLHNSSLSTAYFDNIQINSGFVESRYNQVTNNGFEYGTTGWTSNGAMFVVNNETGIYKDLFGYYSLKIDGDGSSSKYFTQDFTDNVAGGETYLIGGWAKADAVPNKAYVLSNGELVSDDRFFGLRILVQGGDGTHAVEMDYYVPFDSTIEDWQYLMVSIDLPIYVSNVDVYGIYQGEGTAYFDNIQFYRDDLITSYNYDSGLLTGVNTPDGSYSFEYDTDGNLIEVQDQSTTTSIEYDPNDTYIEVEQNNVRTSVLYDSITKHINANYVGYDMSESTQDLWFKTTYTYEHDSQYLDTVTDEFGNTLDYDYNKLNGLLSKITDANGNIVQYEYNKFGQILEKEFGTSGIIYNYTYDTYNRLSTISSDTLTYTFNYNVQDQLVSVKINGEVVVSYTYVSKTINNETYLTHLIESKTYANGDTFYFEYNEEDLLSSMHFNDELENRYEYQYDASGRLAIVKDIANNKIYYYSYSLSNRLEKITDEDGNVILYEYDDHGNLFGSTYQVSGINRSVYYHYNDTTGEYDFTTYDVGTDSVKKDYTYDEDSLRRLKEINLTYNTTLLLHMTFDYDDHHVDASMGNATTRIYKIAYELVDGTDDFYYEYYYDDLGNIVEIIVKDYAHTIIEKYSYEYDSSNRLIREDIYFINSTDSTSISYTYDTLGNITNIKNYSYTTGLLLGTPMSEKVLTYGNDLLGYNDTQLYTVAYKENGIHTGTTTYAYDDAGNPSTIEVSGNQYAYQYEGRRLIGVNFGTTLNTTYAYNDQGIRVYKSTNDHEYEYILDGDLVVIEIIDETDYIYYTYDVNNTLISMCYNGVEYYYLSDTQGNIIGLMNQSGGIVVEYKYDAWGNIINWDDISSNPIARINPYRYRGYRYDEELNLYYLQSRYYDPSIGRFLNMDDTKFLSVDTASSLNLYAYAVNNPVMYSDISGNFPQWLKWTIGAGIIVGLGVIALTIGGSIVIGALIGALVGAGVGLISGVSLDENGVSFDWDRAATGFMLGSITGAISGAIGAKFGLLSKSMTLTQRSIMAGVDGTLSLGAYLGKATIHGDKVSLVGALIASGSGLFRFADPTGYKAFDALWGPMMGAELAWGYDLLSSLDQKQNIATRYMILYD